MQYVRLLRDLLCGESLKYMGSVCTNGGGDLLMPLRMSLENIMSSGQYINALYESASYLNDTYFNGEYLSIDDERPLQCILYGFLYEGLVYGIDIETGNKGIYTLSENHLKVMLDNGLLVEDVGKDIISKVSKMIGGIEGNNKIKQSLSTSNLIYAYRLDDCKHEESDFRRHFKPMSPRDYIDLNKTVLVPMEIYDYLSEEYLKMLQSKHLFYIKTSDGRSGIFTLNEEVMSKIYSKKKKASKDRVEKLGALFQASINTGSEIDRYSSVAIPNLTASVYSSGVNRLNIESIVISYALNSDESVRFLKGEPITINNETFDLSLMYADVRGAKNFLKDKLDYENLSDEKKAKIDSYTDTEAYRYLKKKGIKSISSYATKLRLPSDSHKMRIPDNVDDFYYLLSRGVFEVTVWTKKGESKIVCTTSEEIIEKVYGEDYRIHCNSPSSRLREFYRKLKYCGDFKVSVIRSQMKKKYGIPFKVFGYSEDVEVTKEVADSIYKKLEKLESEIKPSTQRPNQILVTCLTDRKPKEGAGRNLTRSFYIDYVKELRAIKLFDEDKDPL